ncbi:pre-mRNA-splicing factor Cwc26 [Histoplasma capsulatum var. duboisii H88]|uniref:Pre-mRNA-splicing factor Cwc26 n=2 Tax=Ajellomyces capsulatus TaxID=5037 RepID=F0UL95_AJEC8|nr:pre-mRNA-splicing factor cwc26 [Histoplasma capsulatum H143]EGC45369.1 pre-mRNA-splicing factor Cwc26 [Histoplasma capsulatum var. duboisii H88]QSS56012.1 pre-mRNA-splicing factor Cwc26 [Histoplasma capsulatum var. duboisii H88]
MSLAAYLAKNYLTADTPSASDGPKKKRKKNKHSDRDTGTAGLIIADDDPPDLRASCTKPKRHGSGRANDGEDEDSPYTIAETGYSAEFRKSKKSSWKTVGGPVAPSNAEQAAADAILASTAAERAAQAQESEGKPIIAEGGDVDGDGGLRMESGARAGLQTAAETEAMVAAQQRKRERESLAMKKSSKAGGNAGGGLESETIYRDASGRIINVAMKRAEARRAAEEAAAAEAAAKDALTGDVQRREREARRDAVREAKYMPLARTAEDEEMNAELKARVRWNDPAAEFLTSTKSTGSAGAGAAVGGRKGAKKVYTGPAAPNRYGIRPGHRWDGVDRGNGFERQWFEARNKVKMREGLEYAWAMDE